MKRTVSAILLAMLLTSMLYSAFKIIPAEAAGTIYIRADGSIDPPTAPISTLDNVTYTFAGNITSSGDGIVVEREHVIVDGSYYTLQGSATGNGISVIERTNVTVRNTQIENFHYGIRLYGSSSSGISGNSIINDRCGIELDSCSNNTIGGNNIADNGYGICLYDSFGDAISGNNITANNGDGIWLHSSSGNSISENNIINNGWGILFENSANYNSISRNNIVANTNYGILLVGSSHNSVSENNITNNGIGIYIYGASENELWHNNFVDNIQQVDVYEYPHNIWDDGYPSGGNYWSDYTGTDSFRGPYQNETGSDKIGDTPYTIDADNTDSYPLIYPYGYVFNPDFNNDGIIDIFDLVRMAPAFGSVPGVPNWDPYFDLNQDSIIDVFDLVVVALHFGETG
jgi:parallel beta-helix repeat protein